VRGLGKHRERLPRSCGRRRRREEPGKALDGVVVWELVRRVVKEEEMIWIGKRNRGRACLVFGVIPMYSGRRYGGQKCFTMLLNSPLVLHSL